MKLWVTDTKNEILSVRYIPVSFSLKNQKEYVMYWGVFRTQSNIYDGAKSRKIFSQIS